VLAVLLPSVMSVAVTVAVCTVFSVTLNCFVPEENAAFAGKDALVPDEVIPTMSVTVVTTFQFASTAFTVTVNDDPADRALGLPVFPVPPPAAPGAAVSPVCAFGVPVSPLAVPGAAVSPGIKSCSFVNGGRSAMLIRPWSDEKPSVADVGP